MINDKSESVFNLPKKKKLNHPSASVVIKTITTATLSPLFSNMLARDNEILLFYIETFCNCIYTISDCCVVHITLISTLYSVLVCILYLLYARDV